MSRSFTVYESTETFSERSLADAIRAQARRRTIVGTIGGSDRAVSDELRRVAGPTLRNVPASPAETAGERASKTMNRLIRDAAGRGERSTK